MIPSGNGQSNVELRISGMKEVAARENLCVHEIMETLKRHKCTMESSVEIRGERIYPFVNIISK